MKKIFPVLFLLLFSLFFTVGNASAAYIDFGVIPPTAGTINYSTFEGALVGTDVQVSDIVGLGTPSNAGVHYAVTGGVLNFTTGILTEWIGGPVQTWKFGGGGTITLHGGIDFDGNTYDIAPGSELFSGSFQYAWVIGSGGSFNVVVSGFTDTKNDNLLGFFGMPDTDYLGSINLSFAASIQDPAQHTFLSTWIFSGDITNTPVPVPASLLLLGSGLVGLVGLGRKKLFSKN